MNLKEALDVSRRGFLKGAAATAVAATPVGKAVAKATGKPELSHHEALTSMGWKRDQSTSLPTRPGRSWHTYSNKDDPGHTFHLFKSKSGKTSWSHSLDWDGYGDHTTHNHDAGNSSVKALTDHAHEVAHGFHDHEEERQHEYGDEDDHDHDDDEKPKKAKLTSNWGRTSLVKRGRATQAKPKISVKEAFRIFSK